MTNDSPGGKADAKGHKAKSNEPPGLSYPCCICQEDSPAEEDFFFPTVNGLIYHLMSEHTIVELAKELAQRTEGRERKEGQSDGYIEEASEIGDVLEEEEEEEQEMKQKGRKVRSISTT